MTPQLPPPPASGPEAEALAWFVRLRALPGPSDADRQAFARWLGADPCHQTSFAAVERAWALSGPAADRRAAAERAVLDRLLARMDGPPGSSVWCSSGVPRRVLAGLAAAIALLVLGMVWLERPHLLDTLAADHQTGRGERRLVLLPDGSRLDLDAASAVAVRFDNGARRVEVLHGRAFFAVIADGRPFTVTAGSHRVAVRGTRFEVARQATGTLVTVEEGLVAASLAPDGVPVQLAGGQQVHLRPDGPGVVRAVDATAIATWRDGRLVFHGAPLAEVAAVLGRYLPGRLVVLDGALARRTVSGSFPAADPLAALEAVRTAMGFRVTSLGGRLHLLHD